VSSILRALKKLENEPRHLDENRSLDSKFVSLAETGPQRPVSSMFLMVTGGGIVCGLVILAGWWLFAEKPAPPNVTQEIPQQSSKLEGNIAPSSDLNKLPDSAISEKPEKLSIKKVAVPEAAEGVTEQEPASSKESVFPIIDRGDVSPTEKPAQQETVLARETPSPKSNEQINQSAEKTVVASFNTPAIPAKTLEVEIPKLKNKDMKLQAVTWSRAPQKRIAVINNRILREGEMVSGYLIKTINQDDVVLSQEGKKWKLMFR